MFEQTDFDEGTDRPLRLKRKPLLFLRNRNIAALTDMFNGFVGRTLAAKAEPYATSNASGDGFQSVRYVFNSHDQLIYELHKAASGFGVKTCFHVAGKRVSYERGPDSVDIYFEPEGKKSYVVTGVSFDGLKAVPPPAQAL